MKWGAICIAYGNYHRKESLHLYTNDPVESGGGILRTLFIKQCGKNSLLLPLSFDY